MTETQLQSIRRDILRAIYSVYPSRVTSESLAENPVFIERQISADLLENEMALLTQAGYLNDAFNIYPATGHRYKIEFKGVQQIQRLTTLDPLVWGV